MSDSRNESTAGGKVRRLSDAVRRVRIAEAERMDAVSDLHDAERARLGTLVDALAQVFKEIPADDDFFVCAVGGGTQPRLWIDPTSHVVIGRDRRTYRFLKDTRLGRVVIRETTDLEVMADAVTDYIAERTVERDRIQESETLLQRLKSVVAGSGQAETAETSPTQPSSGTRPVMANTLPVPRKTREEDARPPRLAPILQEAQGEGPKRSSTIVWAIVAFLIGMPTGAFAILAYAWMQSSL